MRHEVPTRSKIFRSTVSVMRLGCVVLSLAGCQLGGPQLGVVPSNLSQGNGSSYKPPIQNAQASGNQRSDDTAKAQPDSSPRAPVELSPAAQIRGQSPEGWTSSPGYGDAQRQPMSPSDSSTPVHNYGYPYRAPQGSVTQVAPSSSLQGQRGPGQFATAPGGTTAPPATAESATVSPAQYALPAPSAPTTVYQPPTAPPTYGYGAPGTYQIPGEYGSTIAPGATQPFYGNDSTIAPGVFPGDPNGLVVPDIAAPGVGFTPRQRIAPIDVWVQEARTGRVILGGSVNSDLGVAGQLIIDERNFDIRQVPRSWDDLMSGRAFRGGGQNFRAELMPGNRVERYTVSWTERNLFGYLPYSLSVGGFMYTRQYRDWTEQRLGGRVALGYEITKDLSISSELRLEDVKLFDPRLLGVSELDDALGSNDLYTARLRLAHDTRDSPFMSTEGALLELVFDQVFGEHDYSRGNVNYSRYFLMRERPDGSGRHTLASTWKFGVTGSQTPVFENYFAGGYSTLRGFSFRGASPVVGDVQVGGELMFLGSLEYLFPLTADEMLRGVAFVDYGTVERDLEINSENFRVAPGLGLRVSVPALGPAPLAFDFAYPINHADTDDRQIFSFFMGFTR